MHMSDMYIDKAKKTKSLRTAKCIKIVGGVLWAIMLVTAVLLTSMSLTIIY